MLLFCPWPLEGGGRSQKNSLKPDIYKASLKRTTNLDLQFPRSLVPEKKQTTLFYSFYPIMVILCGLTLAKYLTLKGDKQG